MNKTSKSKDALLPPKHQFTKEVIVILIAKLILIFLIWFFYFSHPLAKHLNDQRFANHLLSNTHKELSNDT